VLCKQCFHTDGAVDEAICQQCARNLDKFEILRLSLIFISLIFVAFFFSFFFTGCLLGTFGGENLSPLNPWKAFFHPVNISFHPAELLVLGVGLGLFFFAPVFVAYACGWRAGLVMTAPVLLVFPSAFPFLAFSALVAGNLRLKRRVKNLIFLFAYGTGGVYLLWIYLRAPASQDPVRFQLSVVLLPLVAIFLALSTWLNHLVMRRWFWNPKILPYWVVLSVGFIWLVFFIDVGPAPVKFALLEEKFGAGGELWKKIESSPAGERSFDSVRKKAIEELEGFARRYGKSDEAARALLEICLWRDARIRKGKGGEAFLSLERVSTDNVRFYSLIVDSYPESPSSAEALLRLGRFYLQGGDFEKAIGEFNRLIAVYGSHIPPGFASSEEAPTGLLGSLFSSSKRRKTLILREYDLAVRKAERELRFIRENDDYGREPLRKFLELDPYAPDFLSRIDEIETLYPGSALSDNIALARWKVGSEHTEEGLEAILRKFPDGDAGEEALFLLAKMKLERGDVEQARKLLRDFLEKYPRSPRYRQALRLLGHQPG